MAGTGWCPYCGEENRQCICVPRGAGAVAIGIVTFLSAITVIVLALT